MTRYFIQLNIPHLKPEYFKEIAEGKVFYTLDLDLAQGLETLESAKSMVYRIESLFNPATKGYSHLIVVKP